MSSRKILPSIISLFQTLLALGLTPTIYALPQYPGSNSAPGTTAAPQQYAPTSTNSGPEVTTAQLSSLGSSIGAFNQFPEPTTASAQNPVSQITTSPQSAYNVPPGQDWNTQSQRGNLGELIDNAGADTVAGATALWTRDLSNKKRAGLAKQVSAEAASLSSLKYAQAASSILAVRDLYAQASNEAAGYNAANPTPVPAWGVSGEQKPPVLRDAQPTWDGLGGSGSDVGGSGGFKSPVQSGTQASFTPPSPTGGQARPTPPPPGVGASGSSKPGVEGRNAPERPSAPGNQNAPGGPSAPGNQNAPGGPSAPDGPSTPANQNAPEGPSTSGNQNAPGGPSAPGNQNALGGQSAPENPSELPAQQAWDFQYPALETMPSFAKRSVKVDAYPSAYTSQIPVPGSTSYASQTPVSSATSYASQMPPAAPTSYASQAPSAAPSSYLPQVLSAPPPTYVSAQPIYSAVPPSSSETPIELYARDNEWQPFNSTISPSNATSPDAGPAQPQPSSSDAPSVTPSENTWSSSPEIASGTQSYNSGVPSVESGSYGGESVGSLATRDAQYGSENATAPVYSDPYGSYNGTDGGWNGGFNETDSGWNTGVNDTLLARGVDISAAQEAQAHISEASR